MDGRDGSLGHGPSYAWWTWFSKALVCVLVLTVGATWPLSAQSATLEGTLGVAWGDPEPGSEVPARLAFHLTEDDGTTTELELSSSLVALNGGPDQLSGRRVEVILSGAPTADGEAAVVAALRVLASEPGPAGPEPLAVIGSQPWVSILCKFADDPDEPKDLAFFQGMYGSDPGQLDHYWREVSYDNIDVVGSLAVDWVVMAEDRETYIPPGEDAKLSDLFNDCTAAANPFVDFSNGGTGGFEGINMMFNDVLDCCAWGGTRFATLDGVSKVWRTTWEPPWGYADEAVMGHEMGHGFGLPHSNNSDGDSSPYDSPWDVMSAAFNYTVSDPTYGKLGKHTIAFHKDMLGWIAPTEKFEVVLPGVYSLTLDHVAAASTDEFRMATIPIDEWRYYSVEAREQVGNYDGNLPGNAVLIFEIDPFRSEDAWLVDDDVPPASFSDNEGVMWKVGETFEDLANEIQVSVQGTAPNGFDVTISYGVPPVLNSSPSSLDFDMVNVGNSATLELQLVNDSPGPQTAAVVSMVLSETVNFTLDPNAGSQPCGTTAPQLAEGEFCTVEVTFAPTSEAAFDEELAVLSNAAAEPLSIPLEGTSVPCVFAEHVVLEGEIVTDTRTEAACDTLTAGPSYSIEAPGDVTLRAGGRVTLRDGFSVGSGASLTVENF
jgi:M6 family metalloprotease-like protein